MTFMLWLFGVALAMELLVVYTSLGWRTRAAVVPLAAVLTAFASGAIAAWRPSAFSLLFLLASLYRIFNLTRITENRMHEHYLRRATRRSTVALAGLQAIIVVAWAVWQRGQVSGQLAWSILAGLQLAVASVLLASTVRRLKRTAWRQPAAALSDKELPTVSVAIPARNETEDLEECLRSIIASDYPKLEIIVLDDCSQTRRTVEIIRGFAHDGVRFIQGENPSDTWLPKNQAYDRLANEASGEYILFCGVDVRFGAESIRQLLSLLIIKKKSMASVLPWRVKADSAALAQSMRYWWELVPPRRLFGRPAVLSTCWIINRAVLERAGGFRAVARSITPEAHFARNATIGDAYSFMRANAASGITSIKASREQRDTAVRTRYPQLHRRPENVFAVTLAELSFLLLPFLLVPAGFWVPVGWPAHIVAALASVLLLATYALLTRTTRTAGMVFSLFGLPFGVLFDIAVLHNSMWQYEFSTVDWKGRNICIPAMHVIPHLPKLE